VLTHPLRVYRQFRTPRRRRPSIVTVPGILPEGGTRQTWKNHVGNQIAQPLQIFHPTTLPELQQIILEAKKKDCHVRAVGSGHSFSDVALTTDYLIDPHCLKRVLTLETALLRDDFNSGGDHFFHVENGITLHDLNDALNEKGLGLRNMGSYTAQTIIGAISTSTHGSGIKLGPLPDAVASLEIVNQEGELVRIEPAGGITDPDKFRSVRPRGALIQSDDVFYSSVVAMGCVGIVYSVILMVVPRYFLTELRKDNRWSNVRKEISLGSPLLEKNRHVDLYINPHPIDGEHRCIIGTRNIVPTPPNVTSRPFFSDLIPQIPGISCFFVWLFNTFYELTPEILYTSMGALLERVYTNVSYKVLDLGPANFISAYSSEIAFPMEGDRHIRGIDAILDVIRECREEGDLYLSVPLGVRFVHESPHYLSMMNGGPTCTVEVPLVTGTHGGMEILRKIEERVCNEKFEGRPHWGQVHTANRQTVEKLFAATFAKWHANYRSMNSSGRFSNAFTNRLSLD
jgi:hypothetical protein